jgi:hypothetical protein
VTARPVFEAVDQQIDYVNIPRRKSREERHNVYKQAVAILPMGERLPCVIRNVTGRGARIEFFQRIALGDQLTLVEPTLKMRVLAKVVWQRDGSAGLRFVKE